MFKSPLVLPLTLIFAGVAAFMITTGVFPASMIKLWPIIFVILGLIGLVSLSTDELMGNEPKAEKAAPAAKKPAAKKEAQPAKKSTAKKVSARRKK